MKCRYSETDIALYVEGDVAPAKACEIEAHLSVCTQCGDLVIELRESQSVLKTLKQDTVSATSLTLVRSHVLAEIQAGVKPLWGRWIYALAGGVFVAVLAVGWVLEMRGPQVQEIVKSHPLPSPAAVPLTRGTITIAEADAKTDRQPLRRREKPKIPSRRKPEAVTHTEVPPEPSEPAKPLVVKLLTDDPNIVIYWLIDNTGGAL